MTCRIIVGDCRAVMATMEPESVDAIVCDPPYGLEFMGKGWDTFGKGGFKEGNGYANRETPSWHNGSWQNKRCVKCGHIASGGSPCRCVDPEWVIEGGRSTASALAFQEWTRGWGVEALRVLAPGAYLLAFGGTRTYHRMAVAIEDAGLEIKDCLSWLYGSGFPKHKSLLKPAWEPIILAKKRGAGTLNVDACRIEAVAGDYGHPGNTGIVNNTTVVYEGGFRHGNQSPPSSLGRWPANVLLDEDAAALLDEQTGELTSNSKPGSVKRTKPHRSGSMAGSLGGDGDLNAFYGDTGGPSRFFYVAKADRSERDKGLEGIEKGPAGRTIKPSHGDRYVPKHNDHPTVKPIALMQWLVRLVTPPGGTVLDPFMGSGSTGIAADREGCSFIGIEQDERYADIARRRIAGDAPLFASLEVIPA